MGIETIKEQAYDIILKKSLHAIKEDMCDDVISGLHEHYYKPVWDMRSRNAENPSKTEYG